MKLQRPSTAFLLIMLAISALMLATAIMLQVWLYRHDRLQLLEQVNGGLAREFAELVQKQTDSGTALEAASRVLARVTHLDNRSGLISMLAVTDFEGERLFYFDDHPQGTYPTPSLQPTSIERDWRPVQLSSGAGAVVRAHADNRMLYLAAPIAARETAARGMVIVGLNNPASLDAFLLGSHSPLVAAAWMLYLAAAIGLFAARRVGRSAAVSDNDNESESDALRRLTDTAPLDAAIIRAEQALGQLNRMAR
jgi:hypothetical protein